MGADPWHGRVCVAAGTAARAGEDGGPGIDDLIPLVLGGTGRESDVRIVGNAIDNVVVGAVRHRHGRIGPGVHGADRCSQRYVLVDVAEGLGPGCDGEGSDGDIGDRDRDRVRSARGRKPAPQFRTPVIVGARLCADQSQCLVWATTLSAILYSRYRGTGAVTSLNGDGDDDVAVRRGRR